ncbi:hypothetical protein VPH49_22145, partial [Pseudomonas luteola]|uniref:hypothetical protein n=1 Tax=Pseudomonas luteola TaxID=47886 RepID=UPI003A8B9DA4
DIYMQVESTPGCIVQRVATFVMINQADETMICRELGQKDTFTLPLEQVSLYMPIVAIQRPEVQRQKRGGSKPQLRVVH